MTADPEDAPKAEDAATRDMVSGSRRPIQFSLRSIMFVVLVVCILCVPGGAYMLGVVYTSCSTAALGIAIWKGRGWLRAFAICAFVPHLTLIFGYLSNRPDTLGAAVHGLLAGVAGAACHSYLDKRDGLAPVPNLPFIRDWFSN